MKILMLQGSPNRRGSTAMLCDEFARGAREAGHDVERVDVAYADVQACTGCVACGYEGPCAQSDGMDELRDSILAADMLVLATPLYYFGMTAQLKTVLDRFCSSNASIVHKHLKSVLLTVAWQDEAWTFDALEAHYNTLVRYLRMTDCGRILGGGCGTPSQTRASRYPQAAYELGRSLENE